MKIAVNVQTLIKDKLEGLGWFTYESLKRIVLQHPEHDFLFIFAKGVDGSFLFADNVTGINFEPGIFHSNMQEKLRNSHELPNKMKEYFTDIYKNNKLEDSDNVADKLLLLI